MSIVAHDQAVGQMELVGAALARLAPRRDQVAGRRVTVDPGVTVAVGDVDVAVGRGDHLGDVIEGASRAGADVARLLAAGVRVLAFRADGQQHLAVQ